jgi:hypothetical protein
MRRSVMTGAVLTVGTVLGVLTVVTAADGRSRRSSRSDCLAAYLYRLGTASGSG